MSEQENIINNSEQTEQLVQYLNKLQIKNNIVQYQRPNKSSTDLTVLFDNGSPISVTLNCVLRAVLFKNHTENLLVITTMSSLIDYVILAQSMRCDLTSVDIVDSPYVQQYDVKLNSYVPITKYLKIQGILDPKIQEVLAIESNVFIPTGQSGTLLQLNFGDYLKLHEDLPIISFGISISTIYDKPNLELSHSNIIKQMKKISLTERRMKERINETFEMPVMPAMADKLLKLRINPIADAQSLGRLVEQDPSLSAQLISWACSPYYGYAGKITSVDDAIIKVLGFDLVMNIALGIAIGQIMNVSNNGRLGVLKHWRHSLYTATFIETLLKKMPVAVRPHRGLAYLCGLLHNFGHLLLGQVFPQQFQILNQMIAANPNVSILAIEYYLFDTDHQKIGAWLMQLWHMPEELAFVVAHHHAADLEPKKSMYANLVFITNRLLAGQDIGDEFLSSDLPLEVIESFQMPLNVITSMFEDFWADRSGLDSVVGSLASG